MFPALSLTCPYLVAASPTLTDAVVPHAVALVDVFI
jgi:hypothetical protein